MSTPATLPHVASDTGESPYGALAAVRWAMARDLKLALRSRSELGVQVMFYVIVVTLFPLASTPERTLLATMGPGVLWVAALLASLLSLPRLFASDHADGTLEQIALSPYPLPALVSGKIVAHWLTTGLPIVILAPLLLPVCQSLGINPLQYGIIMTESFGIGSILPPIGIALYVACAICGAKVELASRPLMRYLTVMIGGLLLVAFVPWITTVLPAWLDFKY